MKQEVSRLDVAPSKAIFRSIIADYDLNKAVCELIDNALDIWVKDGKIRNLEVNVNADKYQQTITINDNAGGLRKEDMKAIVGPGHTTNKETDEVIGFFGVGSKRAVVALAQDIRVATRYGKNKTYQVEFDDHWLATEEWELPLYQVDDIQEGSTIIELSRLRLHITDESLQQLKEHLEATYARFLANSQLTMKLNGKKLNPITFENWAYPPTYEPRRFNTPLYTDDGHKVFVKAVAGLTLQSSPTSGEYGVYIYCNDRLIARGLKTYEVGFARGEAGLPHPSLALARVIVTLTGPTRSMPWNSSKSSINANHPVFAALRAWLIQTVKDYTSLSRRFEGQWEEKVFNFPNGEIQDVVVQNLPQARKSYLPPLPKAKLRYADIVEQANKKTAKNKPWTIGIYESLIAVDLLKSKNLQQRNRLCLILLDSTLEIAFKEYLVNESGEQYSDRRLQDLFLRREQVQNEVKRFKRTISDTNWKKISYYYSLRCKLIHERATVDISNYQVDDYGKIVESVLHELFGLKL